MRRRLSLIGLIAALVLALLPHGQMPAVAALRVSGKTIANQVDHSMPAFTVGELRRDTGERIDATDAGSTGGATLSVTSPVIDAGQLFERVGVHYRAAWGAEDSLLVEVRTSPDGATWGEWELYHPEEDLADIASNTWYIAPQVAPQDSRFAQYRVWLTSGDPAALEHIALTFLDVNDLNAGPFARLAGDIRGALVDVARGYFGDDRGYALAANATGASQVLTRQDWGADESLTHWRPKYVPWQKAVVHHTVTGDGGSNVAAELRAIYYFHARTRGWGDIGYQYLVDKYGNIYQGRQGGDNVVGGHAYGWNDGSFGVAAIGDYSVASPTSAMQGAIANIIALKFKQLSIAPFGSGAFTHEEQRSDGSWTDVTTTVPNVVGHRDCNYKVGGSGGQTACPGGRLYAMMDGLRRLAQTAWESGYTKLSRIDPQVTTAGFPGQEIETPVLVTNRGSETIPAGTTVGYQVLRRGALVTQGEGAKLDSPVAPGATGALVVPFSAPPVGEYIVRWGLRTGSAWWSAVYNDPVRDTWFRSADWSADWVRDDVPRQWTAGETRKVTVTIRNDGGRVWPASGTNPVQAGHYWLSTATGNRFEGDVKTPLPRDVQPGQSVTLTMVVEAPKWPTNYSLVLDLEKENEFWFRDKGLRPDDTEITVATDFKAKYLVPATLPKFEAGTKVKVPVTITNTGLGTFPISGSYPITLGYHWYDTSGRTVTWEGLRTKLPADLLSGKSVTVDALVEPPAKDGTFDLRFDLVQEGVGWFSDKGAPPSKPSLVAVAGPVIPVYAATYQPGVSTLARSGGLTAVPMTITNQGNFTWAAAGAQPITLSYHWIDARGNTYVWEGLRTRLPGDVAPGESVTLQAQVAVPEAQEAYILKWDLVHEGVTWFSGKGVRTLDQSVVVGPPPFYGGSMDVSQVPTTMPGGSTEVVPVLVQNMSDFQWDSLIKLSYHWNDTSGNSVQWNGLRTPLTGIPPGGTQWVAANVLVPSAPGTYVLRFDMVHEGVTWFSGKGMQLAPITVTVETAGQGAQYMAPETLEGELNAAATVTLLLRNTGALAWEPGTVNLAYHLYAASGNVYVWDGARSALPRAVGAGESVVIDALVRMPERAGTYTLRFDLVQEGVAWFSDQGVAMPSTALTVE